MAIIDNLVNYWKLDEASGNRADSHGSSTLTDVNTVGSTTGKINNAASFTIASTERLYNSAVPLTNGTTPIAKSFWFKTSTKSVAISSLTKTTINTTRWFLSFEINVTTGYGSAEFGFVNAGNQGVSVTGAANLADGSWHHVVINIYNNGSSKAVLELYIDNVLIGTNTHATYGYSTPTDFEYLNFGSYRLYTDGSFGRYLQGELDEIAIWDNKTLSSDDVTSLYNAGAGLAYPFSTTTYNEARRMHMMMM